MVPEGPYQCPCCDYYVFMQRARHDTCPICWWEDDGSDLGDLDAVSRANHISLRQARRNFETCGASDEAAVSLVAPAGERVGLRRERRSHRG